MRRYVLIAICLHAFFASVGQVVNPSVLSIEQLGGNGDEFFYGARKVYDGGFILNISTNSGAGNINNSCSNNGRLVYRKYNPAGVLEWEKCRPGIFTISMSMPGEEICFFGVKWVSSLDTLIFQKEDANGNILITKKYDGGGNDYLKDVIQTDDGGFVILGDSYSSGGDVGSHYGSQFFKDIWVFKIDANGIIKWSKVIGGTNDDISYSIVHGPNNGFYIAGNTESNDFDCTGQHGHRDMYLARLDSLGNIIWHRCFGGSQDDGYYVSAVENNGGVIIATGSQSSDGDIHHALGNYDFWVLSVDSSGKIMWENSYGGDNQEVPKNICKGNDASIWIGGSSNRQTGEVDAYYGLGDAWIAHVDADGNFLSGKVLGGNKQDECTLLYPLTTNLIFVGGTYQGPGLLSEEFPSTYSGGNDDLFLNVLAPWTTRISNTTWEYSALQIYPNPANNKVTVKSNSFASQSQLTITDEIGRNVYLTSYTGTSVIDVTNWPRGLYLVQVFNSDSRQISKLILQ